MKKLICFMTAAAAIFTVNGAENSSGNLLKNGTFDKSFFYEAWGVRNNGNVSIKVVEDAETKNKCVRMEITKLKEVNGRQLLGCSMNFGKNGKYSGFAVEPNTVYEISFDYKGNIGAALWVNYYNQKTDKHWQSRSSRPKPAGTAKPDPEKWTTYRGTFKTAADTVSTALVIQFWADSKSVKVMPKAGEYILVDNIVVKKQAAPAAE